MHSKLRRRSRSEIAGQSCRALPVVRSLSSCHVVAHAVQQKAVRGLQSTNAAQIATGSLPPTWMRCETTLSSNFERVSAQVDRDSRVRPSR